MRFPAESVVQVCRLLEENGVPVWLNGGWGVDALLKRETREHPDLDIIVPVECLNAAESALGDLGFLKDDHITQMPVRLVLRKSKELQIDIHPVTLKPDGSAEYIDFDQAGNLYTFVHSAAGLSGVGMISGRIVRCTTAAEQIRQKTESATRHGDSPGFVQTVSRPTSKTLSVCDRSSAFTKVSSRKRQRAPRGSRRAILSSTPRSSFSYIGSRNSMRSIPSHCAAQ
jgi:lincosamide nucleotidyltransferase A/C/D/E